RQTLLLSATIPDEVLKLAHEVTEDPDDGALIHLATHFHFIDRDVHRVGRSVLRFTPRDELAPLLHDAGLVVERWLGDWDGRPYDEARSKEIIVVGRLRGAGRS
ncbi:MAG: hypothetical protein ACFCUQ_06640, partial [Kiloniellales bacterium]